MTSYDQPDPPLEPARVECAGGCGSTIDVDDAYVVPGRADASLCLACAVDALHQLDPLRSGAIGSHALTAGADIYADAARECRRLATQEDAS